MIKFGSALIEAAEQIEREKGISKDVVINSLKDAMLAAYKKYTKVKEAPGVEAEIDEQEGQVGIFKTFKVVKELSAPKEELGEDLETEEKTEDKETTEADEEEKLDEMLLEEAQEISEEAEEGDELKLEVTPDDFGRIAAQSAKQVITQRIREAEKHLILDEYLEKKGTLLTGIVQRMERGNVIVNVGRAEALMPYREQVPRENYRPNSRVRVFVLDVKDTGRTPQVIVSHAHEEIVRELFELEVPEIEDGLIEIVAIARQAGFRTKLAVRSEDANIDPVGSCIGHRGSRIQAIVNELKNEKIDIVRYAEDPAEFIANALSPAEIESIEIMEDPEKDIKQAVVVVPEDQLSLAIGRAGQNVKLAHKLTGWKIDIKSQAQLDEIAQEENGDYQEPQEELAEEVHEEQEAVVATEEIVEEPVVEVEKESEEE